MNNKRCSTGWPQSGWAYWSPAWCRRGSRRWLRGGWLRGRRGWRAWSKDRWRRSTPPAGDQREERTRSFNSSTHSFLPVTASFEFQPWKLKDRFFLLWSCLWTRSSAAAWLCLIADVRQGRRRPRKDFIFLAHIKIQLSLAVSGVNVLATRIHPAVGGIALRVGVMASCYLSSPRWRWSYNRQGAF